MLDELQRFCKRHKDGLKIMGALVSFSIALTVQAFDKFATKREVEQASQSEQVLRQEIISAMEKRLDRFESKLDAVLTSKQQFPREEHETRIRNDRSRNSR